MMEDQIQVIQILVQNKNCDVKMKLLQKFTMNGQL